MAGWKWIPMVLTILAGCSGDQPPAPHAGAPQPVRLDRQRAAMVERIASQGEFDPRVLEAMRRVPRHEFVPAAQQSAAYDDRPLPIGHEQTISQPTVVAMMTDLAAPRPGAKALDVGTGSGYQAAVLAELAERVYSIEIIEPLAKAARARLTRLGYDNVQVRHGDGYRGWPEEAPFDVIILAAAPDHIPPALVEQLAPGGKLVLPVGTAFQELKIVEKAADGSTSERSVAPVAFVPMTGESQR